MSGCEVHAVECRCGARLPESPTVHEQLAARRDAEPGLPEPVLDAVAREVTAADCYAAAEAGGFEVATLVDLAARIAVREHVARYGDPLALAVEVELHRERSTTAVDPDELQRRIAERDPADPWPAL